MAPGALLLAVLLLALQQAVTQKSSTTAPLCSYNIAHTVANCSSRLLDYVPHTLHKSISTLDLSGSNFSTIANQSFISYTNIAVLYLKNSSIEVIEPMAFLMLNYISMLDLSNNKLRVVPSSSFEPIRRTLVQLILSGNKISSINKGTFQTLVNLKHLDLSGNMVYRIEYGAFKGLQSLEVLKLRHNALSHLPSDCFDAFRDTLTQIQLYDNLWICDCKMRWLRQWLNATDPSVWDSPGYYIRCDGPTIVREKPLNSLPLDELACQVQMKTSSSTRELPKGANTTLVCKYASVPEAEAKWLRNSEIIDVLKNSKKYSVESWTVEARKGERTQVSELKIRDFQYEDISKYECFVQNIRGVGFTDYKLTLEGVPFDTVTSAPPAGHMASSGVDTRSIVIAVAVVCGIILLIFIGVLIFCSVNRMQRKKQEKRDAIVENVKKHFITNSESAVSNGDLNGIGDSKPSVKSAEDKLDHTHDDERSNSNNTNDSNATAVKRPLDLGEHEPLYIFEQPESPFNNGNTYVSFGSELTDPNEFPPVAAQYPPMTSSRYESSHAGSATPLLERYTPSAFDSDEPVEDYAQYPVYDSLTNSLHHPHGEGIYGVVPNRNGSTSGYSSCRSNDPAKRLSSFYYPPSVNGSMPMTPNSTRSTLALAPRYTDYAGDGSPRPDTHRHTPAAAASDYRDYRDMRYPATTPPPHRMTSATKKSMSVGNLGYAPLSTGPRKPPRLFQSREYMELTPQESNGDYITSPEAQQYGQNYGITPGTPV